MFYVKEKFSFEDIAIGGRQVLDLDDRKIHFTCPGCGKKMKLWANQIVESCTPTKDDCSAYCPICSEKLRTEHSAEVEDDDYTTADMLLEELIDKTRDTDGAQNFVYLRDMGVIVDIEHCKVPELLDAVIAWADKEKEDLEDSLALCQKRIAELEKAQYRLVWDDDAGEEHQEFFSTCEDAQSKAEALLDGGCGVGLFAPDGSPVEL